MTKLYLQEVNSAVSFEPSPCTETEAKKLINSEAISSNQDTVSHQREAVSISTGRPGPVSSCQL